MLEFISERLVSNWDYSSLIFAVLQKNDGL